MTLIKTWVDDRGGAIKPMAPNLYRAIIDEAHKHNMRVAVHATGLADAKTLLRAGIDVFAHMISDVDDELVALFKQHPNTVVLRRLAGRGGRLRALAQSAAPARARNRVARADQAAAGPAGEHDAGALGGAAGLGSAGPRIATHAAAGVRIGVGTDGGGQTGDQFVGWTMHTEMENMVAAGMTPAQVLVAPRGRPRRFSGSTISGTWRRARAPTSSCSTPIRSTTSRTREGSPGSICAARGRSGEAAGGMDQRISLSHCREGKRRTGVMLTARRP